MSGLEVVGIILAFYPLLVDALAACREPQFAKSAKTKLDTEKIVYAHFVSILLRPHLPSSALRAIQRGEEFNWDPKVEPKVRSSLGPLNAGVVLDTLAEIRELFDRLKDDISSISPLNEQESKIRANLRRFKHNLPRSEPQKRLRRLTELNQVLARVVKDDILSSPPVKYLGRRRPSRDSKHEEELHKVICGSYSCLCNSPHLANLELDTFDFETPRSHYSESNPENKRRRLLFYVPDENDSDAVTVASRTGYGIGSQHNFASDQFCQSPVDWTPVSSSSEQQGSILNSPERANSRRWSNLPTPDLFPLPARPRSRAISVSETEDHDGEPITNLCGFLKSLESDAVDPSQDSLLGHLVKNEKKYQVEVATAGEETISLQDWLEKSKLPRKERTELAIILALAVLRLHSTSWIQPRWTYQDFEISRTGLESRDLQLFISTLFYSTQSKLPATTAKSDRSLHEPILTRLGFALTELGISRPLYEYHDRGRYFEMNTAEGDIQDFNTAKEILTSGELMMEQGRDYQNAVNACLNHQFWGENGVEMINSRRPEFHDNVERCIITPLYNAWENSWGAVGA